MAQWAEDDGNKLQRRRTTRAQGSLLQERAETVENKLHGRQTCRASDRVLRGRAIEENR